MSVSIEQYRQQIGIHNLKQKLKKSSTNKMKVKSKINPKHKNMIAFALLCILPVILITASCPPASPRVCTTPDTPCTVSFKHGTWLTYAPRPVKLLADVKCFENNENHQLRMNGFC